MSFRLKQKLQCLILQNLRIFVEDDNTIRKNILKLVRMVQKLKNDKNRLWFMQCRQGDVSPLRPDRALHSSLGSRLIFSGWPFTDFSSENYWRDWTELDWIR